MAHVKHKTHQPNPAHKFILFGLRELEKFSQAQYVLSCKFDQNKTYG